MSTHLQIVFIFFHDALDGLVIGANNAISHLGPFQIVVKILI